MFLLWMPVLVLVLSWAPVVTPSAGLSSCGSWLLLGPNIESKPSGLGGLTLSTVGATSLTTGPEGINAWVFTGHNYVKITSDGKLDIEGDSFTIATYLYQDVLRDGPIVEWRGRGSAGTHMWMYRGKLYINLVARTGRSHSQFHIAPPTKKWSFVGISYSQQTGNLVMWVDGNVFIKNVGTIGPRDMLNDLYVGLRPTSTGYKFTGKLAATTLMRCAVSGKAQIEELRKLIISRANVSPTPPSACNFKFEGYGYTASFAVKTLTLITEDVCKYECAVTLGCAGVIYRTSHSYCYLKSQAVGAAQNINMANVFTPSLIYRTWNKQVGGAGSTAVCSLEGHPQPCKYVKSAGFCSGSDIRTISGLTEGGCERSCTSESLCNSFRYSANKCYLKWKICTDAQLSHKTNAAYNQYAKNRK
ncbi:uncharacterized protein LOC135494109 [Lineus longissimus]|uniref:uncharacterized protein LOC135494109 n=1 Tax=Lineus longissimus TaxID=88925 RepID=UPI00315CEBF7